MGLYSPSEANKKARDICEKPGARNAVPPQLQSIIGERGRSCAAWLFLFLALDARLEQIADNRHRAHRVIGAALVGEAHVAGFGHDLVDGYRLFSSYQPLKEFSVAKRL